MGGESGGTRAQGQKGEPAVGSVAAVLRPPVPPRTLSSTISGRPSASARASSRETQTTPEVWRIMKAMRSVVILSAAAIKSPSFSRSSSSITTTNSPRATASKAAGMLLNPGVGSKCSSGSAAWPGTSVDTAPDTRPRLTQCRAAPRLPAARPAGCALASAGGGPQAAGGQRRRRGECFNTAAGSPLEHTPCMTATRSKAELVDGHPQREHEGPQIVTRDVSRAARDSAFARRVAMNGGGAHTTFWTSGTWRTCRVSSLGPPLTAFAQACADYLALRRLRRRWRGSLLVERLTCCGADLPRGDPRQGKARQETRRECGARASRRSVSETQLVRWQLNNTHAGATALAVMASRHVSRSTHFLLPALAPCLAPLAAAGFTVSSTTLAWLISDRMTFHTTAQVFTAATCGGKKAGV